ncbi:MAG: argininosuccinate lyase [Gaiellaceae bacterium]
MSLWSARVSEGLDPAVTEFLRADDRELLPYDCAATIEHATRLQAAGILSTEELAEVEQKLTSIEDGVVVGDSDEDVHSAIERHLGEVGRKIHAGRSRNDQVAAALRLYVADACAEARAAIELLSALLHERAAAEDTTLMPGYTHLQRAQPITLGHHLRAWAAMLERDHTRFEPPAGSPLGSGALAGTTLPIPPPDDQIPNSLDAVTDRDFALDYLYAATMLFVHLSRIAEELVLWVTTEFGFAHLPQTAATGSSMMPHKLNPDVAELVRGKAGTAIGRLTGLLATVKALPLAYNRDLQEDKAPVFAARKDIAGALAALTILLADLKFDRDQLAAATTDPHLLATDAAEALVAQGIPFRDAYEQIAAAVRNGSFQPGTTAAESVAARLSR